MDTNTSVLLVLISTLENILQMAWEDYLRNAWSWSNFVKSLPMLSEDNYSVNSCRSGHPWKHRQEPGGPGQHSKDQVLVTSFNTTPPQEYIQMIGHELQQGLNLLFYMYLCVHQYSWTSLILGEMLNSEMLNSEMLYGEMLLSPINWYTSFWRWGCSTVQQSQPTGIL